MANDSQTTPTRRYEQRKRAESQAQATRRRIVEAALELHGTVGPARTTISAIAERAGVRRATVYRHFPDERTLFEACSGLFADRQPAARPRAVGVDRRPRRAARGGARRPLRLVRARRAHARRVDCATPRAMPILSEVSAPAASPTSHVVEDQLARGWGARGRRARSLRAAISLALRFSTWSALRERELERAEAVRLMTGLVRTSA